jgi:hypothetical protein
MLGPAPVSLLRGAGPGVQAIQHTGTTQRAPATSNRYCSSYTSVMVNSRSRASLAQDTREPPLAGAENRAEKVPRERCCDDPCMSRATFTALALRTPPEFGSVVLCGTASTFLGAEPQCDKDPLGRSLGNACAKAANWMHRASGELCVEGEVGRDDDVGLAVQARSSLKLESCPCLNHPGDVGLEVERCAGDFGRADWSLSFFLVCAANCVRSVLLPCVHSDARWCCAEGSGTELPVMFRSNASLAEECVVASGSAGPRSRSARSRRSCRFASRSENEVACPGEG